MSHTPAQVSGLYNLVAYGNY